MVRMTNTYLLAGPHDPEEILRSVKRGVFAVRFSGGQVNISNGDFVFALTESYLIEDGKLTAPLKGVNLIGNGPEVLRQVTMVGSDFKLSDGVVNAKSGRMRDQVGWQRNRPTFRAAQTRTLRAHRAGDERFDDRLAALVAGEDEHGDLKRARIGLDAPAGLQARKARHAQVEQDRGKLLPLQVGNALPAIGGLGNLESSRLKDMANKLPLCLVVFDQ